MNDQIPSSMCSSAFAVLTQWREASPGLVKHVAAEGKLSEWVRDDTDSAVKLEGSDPSAAFDEGCADRWIQSVLSAEAVVDALLKSKRTFSISGAVIRGRLRLADAELSHVTKFRDCVFLGGIDLQRASISELDVRNCVFLSEPPGANAKRSLVEAEAVQGPAEIDRSVSASEIEPVFNAFHAHVRRRLLLTSCCFDEEVRLRWMRADSSVGLDGSSIVLMSRPDHQTGPSQDENDRTALDGSNAHLYGDFHLSEMDICGGGISIESSVVEKQLAIAGTHVAVGCRESYALIAQRCVVGESAVLGPIEGPDQEARTTRFIGRVSFVGASIKGDLDLKDVEFVRFGANTPETQTTPPVIRRVLSRFARLWTAGESATSAYSTDPESETWQADVDLSQSSIGNTLIISPTATAGVCIDLSFSTTTALALGGRPDERWRHLRYRIDGLTYSAVHSWHEEGTVAWAEVLAWVAQATDRVPRPLLKLAESAEAAGEAKTFLRSNVLASWRSANRSERFFLGWIRYGWRPWIVGVPLVLLASAMYLQVEHTQDMSRGFVPIEANNSENVADGMPQPLSECDDSDERCLVPWQYAVDAVTPFSLGQVSEFTPNRSASAGRILDDFVLVCKFASWLLAGVFAAAVAGKLKRTS